MLAGQIFKLALKRQLHKSEIVWESMSDRAMYREIFSAILCNDLIGQCPSRLALPFWSHTYLSKGQMEDQGGVALQKKAVWKKAS